MTLSEYQTKILKLDAEIANLSVEKSELLIEAAEIYYPQYKRDTFIKFKSYNTVKFGRVISMSLDSRNPFQLKMLVKPCKNDGTPIKRVVLHPVYISDKDVVEILK